MLNKVTIPSGFMTGTLHYLQQIHNAGDTTLMYQIYNELKTAQQNSGHTINK